MSLLRAGYPVLKAHNERLAIGYVAARVVEGVLLIVATLSLLALMTLSREFVDVGGSETTYFHTSGESLQAVRD